MQTIGVWLNPGTIRPDMGSDRQMQMMIEGPWFDAQNVFLPLDLMKQAATTFWTKLAMHVFTIREFALPGLGLALIQR